MKQIILGTAGHIDHGKTSLIKALTGIDADRLKEEKERGITIELGFAHLRLPSGQLLGIVDVPGHEKFVKNMVAGATGIDIVTLVVAADEGVMPQTREHLEICQLLDIKHGLVVLTKTDMVEEEWIELIREDLEDFLEGTFLENSPVLEVSSVTGKGLDDLVSAIDKLVLEIPGRDQGTFFRLPIDRVFTMKGFGTVVTGTTISGELRTGEDVMIYPQELPSKVRGIQVHNQEAELVHAGLRTAINLQGTEKSHIKRGNVLAAKDSLKSTYMLDTVLDLLPTAPRKVKNRAKVRFHAGTAEIISTVVLLDRDELEPGDSCFAQIRLDEPTVVLQGDRYIIRSYSPVRAIGGGKILHAFPLKRKRFSKEILSDLEMLDKGDVHEKTEVFIRMGRFNGVDIPTLQFLTNSPRKKILDIINQLSSQKTITQYDNENSTFIHSSFFNNSLEEITTLLSEYHKKYPLKTGLLKEELRSKSIGSKNPKLFNYIVNRLTKEGRVNQEKEILRMKDHKVSLVGDQKKLRKKIEEAYLTGGLQPPYFKEIKEKFPDEDCADLLQVLVDDNVLIKVKEDLYFHEQSLNILTKKLTEFIKKEGEINTPQFKELTGASRKYTIPLIEYFDRTGLTVRVGDSRVLRKQ